MKLHAPCRLELGSSLRTGEWTSDGGWHELLEPPLQMPPGLHQIPMGALRKVRASCVAALHLLWPLQRKRQVLWPCRALLSRSRRALAHKALSRLCQRFHEILSGFSWMLWCILDATFMTMKVAAKDITIARRPAQTWQGCSCMLGLGLSVVSAPKVHELGRGQFGRVWLAHWKGVEVAVKELHRVGDARARAEMLREAQTLAGLRHPCVIALFGILLDDSSVSFTCVDVLIRLQARSRCNPVYQLRPPERDQQTVQDSHGGLGIGWAVPSVRC